MKFGLLVSEGPYTHQASDSAYQFVVAAMAKGHEIQRIFFYHDGVNNATRLTEPPQDDRHIVNRWSALAADHKVDLVVCVAAALRRGIKDESAGTRFSHLGFGPVGGQRHQGRSTGHLWRLTHKETAPNERTASNPASGPKVKKFMFVNRKAPYGTIYALESLEVVLITATFDQDVSLVFIDDGVYELVKGQQTKGIGIKNHSPATARWTVTTWKNCMWIRRRLSSVA
jgi:tRNA 2-thiouridine synthesizing protein D